MKKKIILIVDDNLIADINHAKELFKALILLKIKWVSQVTYNFGLDAELLELAKKSGCIGVFIGFDSVSKNTLLNYRKTFANRELYKKCIKNIHNKGIQIQGSFVFGSDTDNKDIFSDTLKFLEETHMDAVFFGVYTPLPGTPAFNYLSKDNRVSDKNWSHYDYRHCVFDPTCMNKEELMEGVHLLFKEFFSPKRIFMRFKQTFLHRSLFLFIAYHAAYLSRIRMLRKLAEI